MKDEERRARASDYRSARISAAFTLTMVIVVAVLADAVSTTYEVSPIIIAALLGTIAALVGVELRP